MEFAISEGILTAIAQICEVKPLILALVAGSLSIACNQKMKVQNHTYGNYDAVRISHLSLNLSVNFEEKSLHGTATLDIDNFGKADAVILDTKSMHIEAVEVDGKSSSFELGAYDSILGKPLSIPVTEGTHKVTVHYATEAEAEALQWLSPEQTHDKKQPFLFSQSQAILARTWIPLMDAPAVRFTYDATIKVPAQLMAMMSAENPREKNAAGLYTFKQDKPVPSYLMAIAVGDVNFKELGRNTGVYAEPGMLDKSVWEFADMQAMVDSAEALYGPYAWGRYDVLVLPPSFPFGGMENPVLTFATPTIIAGDRSLVSLVAHELAHSWSGNLVTNETWDDFWLNEGFTVYFEQRIMEKLYGQPYAEMLTTLARGELQRTIDSMMPDPEQRADTKLYLNLAGRNPDDGVTDIAYEKGRFFLRSIEKVVGRPAWDAFINQYFRENAFKTMTTERFIQYLEANLISKNPDWAKQINYKDWIYQEGLPSNCEVMQSTELQQVEASVAAYSKSKNVADLDTQGYTTHHWLHMLRKMPALGAAELAQLDERFAFSNSGNAEILCDWFQLCVRNGYLKPEPQMRKFLCSVGRRKFLTPIYRELIATPSGKALAIDIFKQAQGSYHAVAVGTLKDMLGL